MHVALWGLLVLLVLAAFGCSVAALVLVQQDHQPSLCGSKGADAADGADDGVDGHPTVRDFFKGLIDNPRQVVLRRDGTQAVDYEVVHVSGKQNQTVMLIRPKGDTTGPSTEVRTEQDSATHGLAMPINIHGHRFNLVNVNYYLDHSRTMVRAALMVYQNERSSSRKFLVGQRFDGLQIPAPKMEHYRRMLTESVGITMPAAVALVPGFVYRATEPTASAHANGPRPAAHGHHAEPAYELVARWGKEVFAIPLDD